MARPKKNEEDAVEVVTGMDFKRAVRLYKEDIAPAVSKVGEHAQEVSTAYKAIKKGCGIPPSIARFCFKVAEEEDSKREVMLRALNGLLNELGIGIVQADLVDKAEGSDGKTVIPEIKQAPRPNLVVVSDGSETDLTDAADTDARDLNLNGEGFEEATVEELGKQAGRVKPGKGKPN